MHRVSINAGLRLSFFYPSDVSLLDLEKEGEAPEHNCFRNLFEYPVFNFKWNLSKDLNSNANEQGIKHFRSWSHW
jgi:hypothetical protein